MTTILLHIPDLMFGVQVEQSARALGYTLRDLNLREALEGQWAGAALFIVQLKGESETWSPLIAGAKAAGVPVLAFGAHVDAVALRAARQAGADRAVPNSQLAAELPALIAGLVRA